MSPTIIADSRENNAIIQMLKQLGTDVKVKSIQPGDYVLSAKCCVERKSANDFLASIFDGRLFDQAQRLSQSYAMPILIVESASEYSFSNINNPMVFWGALAKVLSCYRLQIIFTPNQRQTANLLYCLAGILQYSPEQSNFEARHKPHSYTLAQRQHCAVESLPGVGPKRARLLLERFGSVREVFRASSGQLQTIQGLGSLAASRIDNFLKAKYTPSVRHITSSTSEEAFVS